MPDRPDRPDSEPCDSCGGPTPGSHSQFCDGCLEGAAERQAEIKFYNGVTGGGE